MSFGRLGGASAAGRVGRAVASPLMATKLRYGGGTGVDSGNTFTQVMALESAFDYVALAFVNDLNAAYQVEGCAVAPSAKRNDDINPLTAADDAVSFTTVTFDNGGAFKTRLEQGASPSTTTFTTGSAPDVTGSTESENPLWYSTDWVACSSLARVDTGETKPLLFIRWKTVAGVNGRGAQGLASDDYTNSAKWPGVAQGRILRVQRKNVNWFTTPANYVAPFTEQGVVPIVGVRYMSRVAGHSIYFGGDSLTMGTETVINANNYGHQTCCLISTDAKPVTQLNGGWAGQTMTQIRARMLREIDLLRPTITVIPNMSYNGAPSTQGAYDTMMGQFNEILEQTRSKASVPVAVTYPPYNLSLATDNLRKAHNDTIRTRAAAGEFKVIDYDAVVTDGASPARTRAEYLGDDNAHINDAGHAAIASQAAAPVLANLL